MVPQTSLEKRSVDFEVRAAVFLIDMFCGQNTNVIELCNIILKVVQVNQQTWYNSGIGMYARPSWKSFKHYKKVLYNKIDLAIIWFGQSPVSKLRSHSSPGLLNEQFWVHTAGYQTIMEKVIVSFYSVRRNDIFCGYWFMGVL